MLQAVRILLILIFHAAAYEIGDECVLRNGTIGICEDATKCISAEEELRAHTKPVQCGFIGKMPVVCCADTTATTEAVQTEEPLRISEQKCEEYLQLDTYYVPFFGGGGLDAAPKEYPHMAILGYNNSNGTIEYQCGGSLISEQFILTSAHCLQSKELGPIAVVRLGDMDVGSDEDNAEPQDFTIAKTYPHPDFDFQSFYNDIALIKLDHPVNISTYVKPACLQTTLKLKRDYLISTGWGVVDYEGMKYNKLQQLEITNLPAENCLPTYGPQPKLERGIDAELQICGGLREIVDRCHADFGNPVQLLIPSELPVHRVIGVASTGGSCFLEPVIYTRVSKYISWIESVVWLNPDGE